MPRISEAEKLRRRRINESVIGTNAMEGLTLDAETVSYTHLDVYKRQLPGYIDVTRQRAE